MTITDDLRAIADAYGKSIRQVANLAATMASEDEPTDPGYLRAEGFGFHIEAFLSPTDGAPVVEIDTSALPDNERGPACRLYLNDAILHEGIVFEGVSA